ncbi:MAG TPA: STAS domain-containing protein [Planctomycetota bacterium]|nr:STAS domain-containing protein [Planctomycetota bacterium]
MEYTKENGVVILSITEADLNDPRSTSQVLEGLLKDEGETKFVADVSKVQNIYSIQIGTLVTMHVMCYENVAVMKLAGANDRVKNLLRMVGLEALMELHHGASIAAESFGNMASAPRNAPTDPRLNKR